MSNLERILKRRRDADEAEVDDLRLVVMARLAGTNGDRGDHLPVFDQRPVIVRRANGDTPGGAIEHPVVRSVPESPSRWLLVAPLEDPRPDPAASVEPPSADRPTAPVDEEPRRLVSIASPAKRGADALDEAPVAEAVIPPVALPIAAAPQSEVVDAADHEVPPQPRQGRRPGRAAAKELRRAGARSGPKPVASADPAFVIAAVCCPYCAVLLQTPPETDDRCQRCGQRMIVRDVGARVAILAEAVLPFFEAERLNEEGWARDRDRWLELARESGAGGDQVPQLAGELISGADVAAARAWYMSGLDRAFQVALKDRRWEEAARIRYEQADVLSRIAGPSDSPSAEVVRLHRDGLAADLQAIGEVAKDAEVRGESCCEACRIDDRRVVQIADELRSPTLPHEGCPAGLCRCRWFLTTRDQELLAALLRRQMGAGRRTSDPPDEPGGDDAISVIA